MIEIFFALSALNRIPAIINFTDSFENILYNLNNVGITKVYTSHRFIKASKLENLVQDLRENKIEVIYAEDIKDSLTMFNKLAAYIKSYFPRIYYKKICVFYFVAAKFTLSVLSAKQKICSKNFF